MYIYIYIYISISRLLLYLYIFYFFIYLSIDLCICLFIYLFIKHQALNDIEKAIKGMSLETALNERGEGAEQFKERIASFVAPIPRDHVGGLCKAANKFRAEVRKLAKKQNKKNKGDAAQEVQRCPLHTMLLNYSQTLQVGQSVGLGMTRAELDAGRAPFISSMDVKPFRDVLKTPGMALIKF